MIMLRDILNNPRKVRDNITGKVFIASAVGWKDCVFAVAAWEVDGKPIRRGKHRLVDSISRDTWLHYLELVEESFELEILVDKDQRKRRTDQ